MFFIVFGGSYYFSNFPMKIQKKFIDNTKKRIFENLWNGETNIGEGREGYIKVFRFVGKRVILPIELNVYPLMLTLIRYCIDGK